RRWPGRSAPRWSADPAPAITLIGEGRVGITIREHHRAPGQRGPDHLGHVLLARRHEEEGLGERRGPRALTLEVLADGGAEGGTVGLAGLDDLEPTRPQPLGEPSTLSGLTGALDAFDGDENAPHWHTLTH